MMRGLPAYTDHRETAKCMGLLIAASPVLGALGVATVTGLVLYIPIAALRRPKLLSI